MKARHGKYSGVLPVRGAHYAANPYDGCNPSTCTNISYHGGAVMHSTKVYTIFWVPSGYSFPTGYATTINSYFQNLAHDSGRPTNVYSTDGQYTDGTDRANYNVTYGGSTTVTAAYPSSACDDGLGSLTAVCLSGDQEAAEINTVAVANGWPRDMSTMYFLYTPEFVGSCFSAGNHSSSNGCAYQEYCAYHTHKTETGGAEVVWANQPWTADDFTNLIAWGCDVEQYPNNNAADPTISVTSHEHNEAATDPIDGGGWWNTTTGMENGDQCAWTFGTTAGADGSEYNQTINGGHYFMQMEWDNASTGCLQTTVPKIFSVSPSSGAAGTASVVIKGSGLANASVVSFNSHNASSWTYQNGNNQITVTVPCGATTGPVRVTNIWGTAVSAGNFTVSAPCVTKHVVADFNGDGKTDVSVWRPSNGNWYVKNQFTSQWGQPSDIRVPGDYDGDGKTDVAVWRPSTGMWYVKGQFSSQWGASTDIPVPGDYNGDGKTDIAVWRPSTGTWYVKGQFSVQYGSSADIPVPGDYNGDKSTDVAVWRPSNGNWYVRNQFTSQWGASTDKPVPGDYNGDGKTDVAVWRPSNGNWYVKNQFTSQWGQSADIPIPGDYDGDGKTDVAVWRASNGNWYVKNQFTSQWGGSTDKQLVLPYAIGH